MAIPFEGTLTEQQYMAAYRQTVGAELRPIVYLIGLIQGVGVIAFWFLTRLSGTSLSYVLMMPLIVFPLILSLIFGIMYFIGGRQAWAQQPPGVRGEVTEEGLCWSSDVSETRSIWTAYTRRKELDDILLLYAGAGFVVLPRVFFASAGDWEAARALVRENIPMQ